MNAGRWMRSRIGYGLLALLALIGAAAVGIGAAQAGSWSNGSTQVVKFDVAEDMSRFVFDQDVTYGDGMPSHGSAFITQGYLYPNGPLNCSNGVIVTKDKDGKVAKVEPEFPDKVLGEWTCRGWFVGEGAHAKTGPMVITTQLYNFGQELGNEMLVSEGYELADVGVAIERAITGGTGAYRLARGTAQQTFLGFNTSEGVNLRLELEVQNR